MKKLILIAALMLSVVSFASETGFDEKISVKKSNSAENELNSIIYYNNFDWNCTTTLTGYWTTSTVKNKLTNVETTTYTFNVTGGCTTCFAMGHKGVESFTDCW